ncbi:MAG: 4-hydroxy-tetrahydrodipicolinate reductase [Angelakisella sp.]
MIKIILSGCCGTMGQAVAAAAAERDDCEIVAGLDRNMNKPTNFPVYTDIHAIAEDFDVIIDFSTPKALDGLLEFALTRKKPLVIATTGFSEDQIGLIENAAAAIPVFFSANMSLGVSLMRELAVIAARVLGGHFDIEIVEKHHNKKIDAPSGTALMLANAVSQAVPYDAKYVYDRHSSRVARDKADIGIHSIRGGTIVGEHEVIFAGQDELLTLTHTAYSKGIFAYGALSAAIFIKGQKSGLYEMSDLTQNHE